MIKLNSVSNPFKSVELDVESIVYPRLYQKVFSGVEMKVNIPLFLNKRLETHFNTQFVL